MCLTPPPSSTTKTTLFFVFSIIFISIDWEKKLYFNIVYEITFGGSINVIFDVKSFLSIYYMINGISELYIQ